jgi:hypothetical protein
MKYASFEPRLAAEIRLVFLSLSCYVLYFLASGQQAADRAFTANKLD